MASTLRKFDVTANGETFEYTSDSILSLKADLALEYGNVAFEWVRHGKAPRWTATGGGLVIEVRLVSRNAAELSDGKPVVKAGRAKAA